MVTFNLEKIKNTNKTIKDIKEIYALHVIPSSLKSADKLLDISRIELGYEICIEEVENSANINMIKGMVVFAENKSMILLNSQLNNCMKRMVLCKEIFHILIENPEFESINLDHQLSEVLIQLPTMGEGTAPNFAQDKWLAEYAAMEFLFPLDDRLLIMNQCAANGEEIDYADIAEKYKVPRLLVEQYLSDEYVGLCRELVKIN